LVFFSCPSFFPGVYQISGFPTVREVKRTFPTFGSTSAESMSGSSWSDSTDRSVRSERAEGWSLSEMLLLGLGAEGPLL
jgi:hypothetical protein